MPLAALAIKLIHCVTYYFNVSSIFENRIKLGISKNEREPDLQAPSNECCRLKSDNVHSIRTFLTFNNAERNLLAFK